MRRFYFTPEDFSHLVGASICQAVELPGTEFSVSMYFEMGEDETVTGIFVEIMPPETMN